MSDECQRCGIRHPLVLDVVSVDPPVTRNLCANCKVLKGTDEFHRPPTYGPVSATGWPYPVQVGYQLMD